MIRHIYSIQKMGLGLHMNHSKEKKFLYPSAVYRGGGYSENRERSV